MRRKDREITGRENIEPILRACKTCRVAMIADGAPYVVPLNFGYTWDDDGLTLYFHSGLKGKKIDALRADPRVCFELDTEQGVTGEGDTNIKLDGDNALKSDIYRSGIYGSGSGSLTISGGTVTANGGMEFAKTPDEKRKGFDVIMQHQTGRSGFTYNDASLSVAEVFHVRADSFEASRKALRPRKPE